MPMKCTLNTPQTRLTREYKGIVTRNSSEPIAQGAGLFSHVAYINLGSTHRFPDTYQNLYKIGHGTEWSAKESQILNMFISHLTVY